MDYFFPQKAFRQVFCTPIPRRYALNLKIVHTLSEARSKAGGRGEAMKVYP